MDKERLARAIAHIVDQRLDRGTAFIRVPELVSPMPVESLVGILRARSKVRLALLLSDIPDGLSEEPDITNRVSTAIDWRNDSSVIHPIVVVGDLERDRASGLADVPTLSLDQVRRQLFHNLAEELQGHSVPQAVSRMLNACGDFRALTDLNACADYCASLLPIDNTTADRARSELWRVGLLPDAHATLIDLRRLRANISLVQRLRAMDATTRQRVIRHLAAASDDGPPRDYSPIRRFAATGNAKYLSKLSFEEVNSALRSTQKGRKDKPNGSPAEPEGSIVQVVREDGYDERAFLAQIVERDPSNSDDRTLSVGDIRVEWEFQNLDSFAPLMSDPGGETGYESQSGAVETLRPDDPFAAPGRGQADWRSLIAIAEKLRTLEEQRSSIGEARCAVLVDEIIGLRSKFLPFLDSILTEGVRLFVLSQDLRQAASGLVDAWVNLWASLEELRTRLQAKDHVYLQRLAEQLASCDLLVTRQANNYNAYVLPLHPIVLEPRVRAADLFLQSPDLPSDFFDLVVGSLDPAMPSLSVPIDGMPVSLSYAGTYRGLPQYARVPRQVDSSDVLRTLQQITERFINVHPYASLSLSVGLVDPPARTAKQFLRWLGDGVADRVALHVYTTRGEEDDLKGALDESAEELVSGEVSSDRFAYDVQSLESVSELPSVIEGGEQRPHVVFTFDLGDLDQTAQGGSLTTPPLGSLISEWVFDTDPLEDARPVIRPRSGSDQLTQFVTAQAGLFSTQLPSQQRSPLLSPKAEETLADLAEEITWVVLCEGASALVPPLYIGDMHLIGRMSEGSHVAFVYSGQVSLLLEPVLTYLWKSTWIDPDRDAVTEFLLGTVRMAMPEGLLGFFKARGTLSKESVLGRLGFAAVIAYLMENGGEHEEQLIVSLDTEGARRWLGLRDGPERRADLVVIGRDGAGWLVEAVEIKARTEPMKWEKSPPDAVQDAIAQVREMQRLLVQIFPSTDGETSPDAFSQSRREILKRQVFLEALQQWESVRRSSPIRYTERIDSLNELFAAGANVKTRRRVFLVNPNQQNSREERIVVDADEEIAVVALGVPWLRKAVQTQPGSAVEIPAHLLDQMGLSMPEAAADDHLQAGGLAAADHPVAAVVHSQEPTGEGGQDFAEMASLAERLREAFVARNAPFRRIETDKMVLGPAVVQIPFSVPAGAKLAALQSQEEDLSRDIGVQAIRISNWAGHPGFAVAELPRTERDIPDVTSLREVSRPEGYLSLALGAALDYAPRWVSLDELPHLLVAGTTGSGKSVFLRSILWQLTNLYAEEDLEIVLIDAKGMADYLDFVSAPHFRSEADFHSGVDGALDLLADVIERRLPERRAAFRRYAGEALTRAQPAQISNLRALLDDARRESLQPPIRPLILVVDEFAELVMGSADRKRFEQLVTRFVQVARAVGGHLIAATQRPSTDVVTGVMKGNFARVALRVQQSVDSRVILDENGAETLLGRGDLLFKSAEAGLVRLQGYSAIGPYQF